MRPGPLPAPLPEALPPAFPVRLALNAGISPDRLRSEDLDASIWGVRTKERQRGFDDRCRALLARMPDRAFISHVSALRLHGIRLPKRFDDGLVDIALASPHRAPHAAQIRGHRLAVESVDLRHGFRASMPPAAWVEAATQLTLPELVAVGDQLIGGDYPLASIANLATTASLRPRHLAGARMRLAFELMDGAAESFPESLLRVALVLAGFSTPVVNAPVRVGRRTYRPDMAYPAQRVIVEYQGDYHRDPEQWRADVRRRNELEAAGWTVIEATWSDIVDPTGLIERLRGLGVQ